MSSPSAPPRFQFSLRRLFTAITVVAVLMAICAALGFGIGQIVSFVVYVLLPVPLAVSAYYCRGDIQTFAIGALVPCIPYWMHVPSLLGPLGQTILFLVTLVFSGSSAVITRRWLERRGLTADK